MLIKSTLIYVVVFNPGAGLCFVPGYAADFLSVSMDGEGWGRVLKTMVTKNKFVTSARTVCKPLSRCCVLVLHHPNTHVPGQRARESQSLSLRACRHQSA